MVLQIKLLLVFLLLLFSPQNFFVELNVGDRMVYSYPGQIGSITYVSHEYSSAEIRWCHFVYICETFTMFVGDTKDEQFNRPMLYLKEPGLLQASSQNYDMRELYQKTFLPGMVKGN